MSGLKNFPAIFRTLAGIQSLFTVALVALVVGGFDNPNNIEPLGVYEYPFIIFAAVWSLICVLNWFFASKGSYHYLYSNGINFLVIAFIAIRFFLRVYEEKNFEEDLIFGSVISGLFCLYGLTLLLLLFRKRIKEWTSSIFSFKHVGLYILLLLLVGLSVPNFYKFYDHNGWRSEIFLKYDYFLNIEDAIERNDNRAIGASIRSGNYNPNLRLEDGSMTLFEYLLRKYDNRNWGLSLAKHPDITMETRALTLKNILRDLRGGKTQEWYIDNGKKKINFGYQSQSFLNLIRAVPDEMAEGMKYTLDERSFILYADGSFILAKDQNTMTLGVDYILDVLDDPEYKDVVKSVDGKELVIYTMHPSEPGPKHYVEVFSDPFQSLGNEFRWQDKLLFSAVYPFGYKFDGSMEFPDNMEVISSKLELAADYDQYLRWVEGNLSSFETKPRKVPVQYLGFIEGKTHLVPVDIQRNIDGRFDLLLFRWESDYNSQLVSFYYNVLIYEDRRLKANKLLLKEAFYEAPGDRYKVSIVDSKVKVFRQGYTEVVAADIDYEEVFSDTTYYYMVSDAGELSPWSDVLTINGDKVNKLSIDVKLRGFGEVQFITTTDADGKVSTYLVEKDNPVYQYPELEVNNWIPVEDNEHEWQASFVDLNDDGLKDLVYRAAAVTGHGPNGRKVFWSTSVYLRVGEKFELAEGLPEEVNDLKKFKKVINLVKSSLKSS